MATSKQNKRGRGRVTKASPRERPRTTTIRLDAAVQKGLRFIEAHGGVKRPLNKLINLALAELIERQTATIERDLEQALRNIAAYRKTDPGYKRVLKSLHTYRSGFPSLLRSWNITLSPQSNGG